MAFQTGTKVDPRLMKADLSGFSRGTELAMAGIGAAIKGYATKKKENEQINFAAESLAGQANEIVLTLDKCLDISEAGSRKHYSR